MRKTSIIALAGLLVLGAAPASAAKRTSETFTFADPFSGAFDCGTFEATYSGHDRGRVTTWFDANGDPIMQVGHIWATETDVNQSTGTYVVVRTAIAVHVDFAAGTTAISGARNMANAKGSGVVVQHVGRVITNDEDEQIFLSGKYPEFLEGYMSEDFCAAIA